MLKNLGLAGGAGRKLDTISTFASWTSGLLKVPLPGRERKEQRVEDLRKKIKFPVFTKLSLSCPRVLPGELIGRLSRI